MLIDAERLEQIQAVLYLEDSRVSFWIKGEEKETEDESWYVSEKKTIYRAGPITEEGDYSYFIKITTEDFLAKIKDKEIIASLYNSETQEHYSIETWDALTRELGISDLIVLATKVPKTIAKRFAYLAERRGTKSEELRRLVFKYVKENMIEDIDTLMFKENI